METVGFDVRITQTDYLKFNYWVSAVRQKRLALSIIAGILLIALLAVGIWVYTFTNALVVLIVVVVFPLLLVVQFVAGWRRVKKSYAMSREIQQPIHYTFKKNVLTMDGASGEGEYTRDMIQKAFVTKNYIYIRMTTKRFLIIPKRDIPAGKEGAILDFVNP